MKTIEQKRADRFAFMKKLYQETEGNRTHYIEFSSEDFGKDFDWSEPYFQSIYQYLNSEGLITNTGITHKGIKEVEEALLNPGKSTDHFPAINLTINHISGNSQSNIQVGNHNSASIELSQSDQEYFEKLERYLGNVLQMLETLGKENAELTADYQTLKAQLESPKPKKTILQEVAKSVKTIVEGAIGGIISNVLSGPQLLGLLSQLKM